MTIKFLDSQLIFNVAESSTTYCSQQSTIDGSKFPKCRLRGGGLPSPISIIPQSPLFSNMAAGCQTTMPIMCYPPFSPQQHQSLVNASYQCYPVLMYASQSPFQSSLPYPCCSPPTIILALPHLPPTSFGENSWMSPGANATGISEGEVSPNQGVSFASPQITNGSNQISPELLERLASYQEQSVTQEPSVTQETVEDVTETTYLSLPPCASPRNVVKQGTQEDLGERTHTSLPKQASPRKIVKQGMLQDLDERTHTSSKLSPVKMHFLRNKPLQLGGFPSIKKGLCPSAIAKKILPFQLLSPVKEVSSHLERSYTSPIKPTPQPQQPGVNDLMTSLSESRRSPSKKHSWSHERSLYTSTPKNTFTAEAAPPGTAANVDHRHFLQVEGLSPIPIERPAPKPEVKERSYHDSDFKELLCDDESSEIQNSTKKSVGQISPEFFDLQCSSMSNVELDSEGCSTPGSSVGINPQADPIKEVNASPMRFCPVREGSAQPKLSPEKMHFLRYKPLQLGGFPSIKKGLRPSALPKKILPFKLLSPVAEASSRLERSYTSPIKPGVNNLMTSLSESRRSPSKKHSSHERSLYTSTPKNTLTAEAAPPGTAANVDHRHFLQIEGLSPIPIERPAAKPGVKERSYHDSDFKELLCDDESSEIQNSTKKSVGQTSPECFNLQCSSMSNVELDSEGSGTPGSLAGLNPNDLNGEQKYYLDYLKSFQRSRREELINLIQSRTSGEKSNLYESR
jgi:hypothetical protein